MSSETTQLLLVGTDHLSDWDGADGRPDILSAGRQRELDELVDCLAPFEPTKVAVEVLASRQADIEADFRSYIAGERVAERNEIDQIAFRLARQTGASVHAIDADWTLTHAGVEDFFERHPTLRFETDLSIAAMTTMMEWPYRRANSPIREYFAYLNTAPHVLVNDREYLDRWLTVGAGDNWGGIDLVASWYRRNLRIFANLQLVADAGERIVVVIGSGHVPSLRQFIETSARLEFVDPLLYLE